MSTIEQEQSRHTWKWYELKYEIAEFLLAKLTYYKESYNANGYSLPDWVLPGDERKQEYSDVEEKALKLAWNLELDKMINAYRQILNYTLTEDETIPYNEDEIKEGLDSFSKHYLHLWD